MAAFHSATGSNGSELSPSGMSAESGLGRVADGRCAIAMINRERMHCVDRVAGFSCRHSPALVVARVMCDNNGE